MKQSIALSLVEGIGSRHMRKLLDTFGSADAVMEADIEQLMSAGLPLRLAQRVASHASEARARSVLDLCERTGVRVLTSEMDAFPRAFAECPDAPCVLYVRGDIDFNSGHWLSVVGTRNATPGGIAATERAVSISRLTKEFTLCVTISTAALAISATFILA